MAKKIVEPAKIFTIGFTKKSAESFFELLELHRVTEIVDVRLFNSSHLAGFAKIPDLKFFLRRIAGIEYRHDLKFAPPENLFKLYHGNSITWEEYEEQFNRTMRERRIVPYILQNYSDSPEVRYCLLCSEVSPVNCHRRLVAEQFAEVLKMEIVHL